MRKQSRYTILSLITLWLTAQAPAASSAIMEIDGDTAGTLMTYSTKADDDLYTLARQFDVGFVALLAANHGVDVWLPTENTQLIVPKAYILPDVPRQAIVINLSAQKLYFYPDDAHVYIYPIGIGREGWQTPVGEMRIVRKKKDPVWVPPPSIRRDEPGLPDVVPAGPDNPMGAYALYLGTGSYAIHGTNKPYGIGKRSSHGCIRMYPEDIEELFQLVKEGVRVRIIDVPYALGWRGDKLYLSVNPTQDQADVISEEYRKPEPVSLPEIYEFIKRRGAGADIDWYAVESAVSGQTGVPVKIGVLQKQD